MKLESITSKENNEKEKARIEIMVIRDEVLMMGANDYEPSVFRQILEDLEAGRISPQKAMEDAHKIEESKMDYH